MLKYTAIEKDYCTFEFIDEKYPLEIKGKFSISNEYADRYYLFNVYAPGHGAELMEEIIAQFPNLPIELDVKEENFRARKLYEKFGFKPTYFWANEKDEIYIEMRREVSK